MIDFKHIAHMAYNSYADKMNWRIQEICRSMPNFDYLPKQEQEAWIAALQRGITVYNESRPEAFKDQQTLTAIFGWLAETFPREWEERAGMEESEFETLKFFFERPT